MVVGTDAAHVLDASGEALVRRQSERGAHTEKGAGARARAWGLAHQRAQRGRLVHQRGLWKRSARNSVPFLGSWSQYVSAAPSYLA